MSEQLDRARGTRATGIAAVARGPTLELLILPFLAVALAGLLTPNGMASSGDPYVFFGRAESVLKGLVPFVDFPSEYPPLSLLPMTLPHLWPDVDRSGYFTLLNIENGVLASAVAVTILWLTRRSWSRNGGPRTLATWALFIVVMAPIGAWRFDLMAVLLMMLGVIAAARGRPGVAGVILGLATLTKIFPLVVVPILAIRCLVNGDTRGAVRLVAACVVTGALVMGPLLAAAGSDALSFIDYQFARGLQIESAGGGIVLLAHALSLVPATTGFSHYSYEASSPLSATIISLLTPLTVAVYALIFAAAWRRMRAEHAQLGGVRDETVVAYLTAALLVLLLTNKVFSPQYLLWMLPLGALLERPKAYLLLAACVLTAVIFPLNYQALLDQRQELVMLLNARNLLLVVLCVWLLMGHVSTRVRSGRSDGRDIQGAAVPAG